MPAKNKDRLYVGLHARPGSAQMPGKEDTYHWSIFISPKNGTSATRFHAIKAHSPDKSSGQPRWSYEETDTILAPVDDLLVLVCVAKIVDREKVETAIRETPIRAGLLSHGRHRRSSYHPFSATTGGGRDVKDHDEVSDWTDEESMSSASSYLSDARSLDSMRSTRSMRSMRSSISAELAHSPLPPWPPISEQPPRARRVMFAEAEPTLSTVSEEAEDQDEEADDAAVKKVRSVGSSPSAPMVVNFGRRKSVMPATTRPQNPWLAEKCADDWNCVDWVKDALAELESKTEHGKGSSVVGFGNGGKVLGRAMIGWRGVRDAGMGYLEKKKKDGRWDGSGNIKEGKGKWNTHAVPTFDMLSGLELVA